MPRAAVARSARSSPTSVGDARAPPPPSAATLVAADRDPLAGRVAGPPQDCIALGAQSGGPTIIDAQTILYRDGTCLYRTGPRGKCPSLRPFNTLIVEITGGQLCRGDRFRVLQPGSSIPSNACQFTEFTPYTTAK